MAFSARSFLAEASWMSRNLSTASGSILKQNGLSQNLSNPLELVDDSLQPFATH